MTAVENARTLYSTAVAVDAASATLKPLLSALDAAERDLRRAMVVEGLGVRSAHAGATAIRALAVSLLAGGSELDGVPLASIVAKAYGDLIEGGAA